MPDLTTGIDVFFYTMAATAFLIAVVYIVRRRRSSFHYQAAHSLDEEDSSASTEMSKRSSSSSISSTQSTSATARAQQHNEQKIRDELFDEPVDDIDFDRDELDQLRMLSAVRAANDRAGTGKGSAVFMDESDESDDDEKKDVIIDMPAVRPPAASQPTQPLPSPMRLQHRLSAGGGQQAVDRVGKDGEKEERKEAEIPTGTRADRHERAVV